MLSIEPAPCWMEMLEFSNAELSRRDGMFVSGASFCI